MAALIELGSSCESNKNLSSYLLLAIWSYWENHNSNSAFLKTKFKLKLNLIAINIEWWFESAWVQLLDQNFLINTIFWKAILINKQQPSCTIISSKLIEKV